MSRITKANAIAKLALQGRISAPLAAYVFGVTQQTVRNWIKSGKLDAIQIGKRYEITSDEIHRVLGQGTRKLNTGEAQEVVASDALPDYDSIADNYAVKDDT